MFKLYFIHCLFQYIHKRVIICALIIQQSDHHIKHILGWIVVSATLISECLEGVRGQSVLVSLWQPVSAFLCSVGGMGSSAWRWSLALYTLGFRVAKLSYQRSSLDWLQHGSFPCPGLNICHTFLAFVVESWERCFETVFFSTEWRCKQYTTLAEICTIHHKLIRISCWTFFSFMSRKWHNNHMYL